MKIKTIMAIGAMMAALGSGAAAAEDQFAIVGVAPAEPMTAAEMDGVIGQAILLTTISTSTTSSFTTLSTSTSIVADNGSAFESPLAGISFEHGSCPGTVCGGGKSHLTGWSGGDPIPRR